MLEAMEKRWKETELWSQLESEKLVVVEPRKSHDKFGVVLKQYYTAVETSKLTGKGALFLAVHRGKVSEGLDFADHNARGVILVGVPFPNTTDICMTLKRDYNNQNCKVLIDILTSH